jgi:hypothetical protein
LFLSDSYQEFTIFVIQLLSKSEALYKPCATFKGRFQNPRVLFTCNDGLGHQGRYVYIRDDRRDQDYFSLCEVEVFAYRGKRRSATHIFISWDLSITKVEFSGRSKETAIKLETQCK